MAKGRRHWRRLSVMFSLLIFLSLTVTVLLTGALAALLYHFGILAGPNRGIGIFLAVAASVFVGTLLSKFAGRQPLSAITAMSEAAKEVAKGNFSISLSEDCPVEELQDMAHNFNLMAKELELEIDLEAVDYCGSKDLLVHVWENILSNAVKFASQRGIIRILLRREDGRVLVCIADTGPGMSEEVRQRVFEKFYQGDVSRSSQGNGLGLALAKRIVDLHDGEISVSTKERKGTTFTVSLPL